MIVAHKTEKRFIYISINKQTSENKPEWNKTKGGDKTNLNETKERKTNINRKNQKDKQKQNT